MASRGRTTSRGAGERWDAVVIGAGLGGLTAAAYLAACGRRVVLLEQYAVLGGASHVFRRKRQWEFDVGVHYVENAGPGGHMPVVLGGLGLADRVGFLPLDGDGFDTILGPDFELRVPHGWDAYLENLIGAFPSEERALRRYVRLVRTAARGHDRSSSRFATAPGAARMVAAAGPAAAFYFAPWVAMLAACGLSARATMVLSIQVCAYASAPHRVPLGMHASWLEEFVGGGAWYPRGGAQTLAANLFDVIRTHGGSVRTHAEVERILVEDGRVVGVRLVDGEALATAAVVSNADIKRTFLELVGSEHLPRRTARRARRWKMSWPFVNTYFGLARDLRGTANTNYFVIPSWEGTASMLQLARLFPDLVTRAHRRRREDWLDDFVARQAAYVQSSTARDPGNRFSAPPGCAAVQSMTLVPRDLGLWGLEGRELRRGTYRREPVYRELKQRLTAAMLDRVERAYPGARREVRWSEAATPATQTRYTMATGGAAFGLEARATQFGPFRPRARTPLRGLFLAGASTAWGPGSVGAMLSGMHAAGAVLGRDLNAEVRGGTVVADPSLLSRIGDPLAASRGLDRRHRGEASSEDPDAVRVRAAAVASGR